MTLKFILISERNYAQIVGKGKIIGDRSDEWFPGAASQGEGLSIKGQGIWEVMKLFCVMTVVVDILLYAFVKTHRTVHKK